MHPDPECLHRAERRSAFPRALRVPGPLDTGPVRERIGVVSTAVVSNAAVRTAGARDTPGSVTDESKVDPS